MRQLGFSRRRHRSISGFTLVELMMAIALLTIGLVGVFSMQKVTAVSNQNTKNLALATHLAAAWLDTLQADSGQWNAADNFDGSDWLSKVGAEDAAAGTWFRPTYSATRKMGPGFDYLGNAVVTGKLTTDAHFCSDIRLVWLSSQTGSKRGAGLIRAEVRVYWLREGITRLATSVPAYACALTSDEMSVVDNQQMFHMVFLSTALKEYLTQ